MNGFLVEKNLIKTLICLLFFEESTEVAIKTKKAPTGPLSLSEINRLSFLKMQ